MTRKTLSHKTLSQRPKKFRGMMNKVQFFDVTGSEVAARAVVLQNKDGAWESVLILECDSEKSLMKVFAKEGRRFNFDGVSSGVALRRAIKAARKADEDAVKANRQRVAGEVADLILTLKGQDQDQIRDRALDKAAVFVRKVFD